MNSLQLQIVKILPRCTAAVSFLGSSYITYDVRRKYRTKKWTVHDRLLVSMSVCDIITSTMFLIGDLPFPVADGGKGNQATCNAQGFLVQLIPATVMYNGSLALYYLLFIRYGWKEHQLVRRMEIPAHIFIWTFVIATGIACIYLELFNPALFDCWIIEAPIMCTVDPNVECTRGNNAPLYQGLFYYGPVYVVIILSSICLFLVYRKVKEQEKKSNKWNIQSAGNSGTATSPGARNANNNRKAYKHSRRVAVQGMFYIGAFYLTWMLPTISRLLDLASQQVQYPVFAASMFLLPLQGFFNCLVYIRPAVVKYFRDKKKKRSKKTDITSCTTNATNRTRANTSTVTTNRGRGSDVEEFTNADNPVFHDQEAANQNSETTKTTTTTTTTTTTARTQNNGIKMSDNECDGHPPPSPNLGAQILIPEENNSSLLEEEEKLEEDEVKTQIANV